MRALFLVALLTVTAFSARGDINSSGHSTAVPNCSDGWRITGYYTPIETEFSTGEMRQIDIDGIPSDSFNSEFLRTIFDERKGYGEGWGKTRFGWYLGYYGRGWHRSSAPLDAEDRPLKPNTIAVDNSFIPRGSLVTIPGLPGDLATMSFESDDIGVSVHGKHIDIYTGEGEAAGRRMYQITFEDNDDLQTVCFEAPASN